MLFSEYSYIKQMSPFAKVNMQTLLCLKTTTLQTGNIRIHHANVFTWELRYLDSSSETLNMFKQCIQQ